MTEQTQTAAKPSAPDSSEGSGPSNDPGHSHKTSADRAKELLKLGVTEVQKTARVTSQQIGRLLDYGGKRWSNRSLQRAALAAQAVLGQRLNELGIGDANLRSQFAQLHERILNVQAAKGSTRRLETERTGLQVRLAEPFLTQAAPAGAEREHAEAVAAVAALKNCHEQTARARETLVPPDRPSRLRAATGLGTAAFVLILLVWLVLRLLGGLMPGFGPSLGPSGKKLIGTWTGTKEMAIVEFKMKFDYRIEFKLNGRVEWTSSMEDTAGMSDITKQMFGDISANNLGTGKWKVDRIEGDTYIIHVVNDLAPDKADTVGWRITFDEANKITIVNFEDIPLQLERK